MDLLGPYISKDTRPVQACVMGGPGPEALQKYKNRSDPIDPSAHLGAELWLLLRQLERMYKVYHTVCLGCQ